MIYIAYDENSADKKTLASTMITLEMSCALGGLIHWIQSVYVIPEARKKGIFRLLHTHCVAIAKADPMAKCVRLFVETDNSTAQTVYEKLNMTKMDTSEFNEIDLTFSH